MRTLVKALLAAGFGLLVASVWLRHDLPAPERLLEGLQQEPEQLQVREAPFNTSVGGVTYTIKPLYSYELQGLVVSLHDSSTWWDYLHREWNDHLNVVDFCVIWGSNAGNGVYRNIEFSSGQFTCNFRASSMAAAEGFDMTAISNNHLLTDDPYVAKQLRSVRIGDQIRFRGYLAEYAHNHNGQAFQRGTSTVRNDTGNGACETVFVKSFDILNRGGGPLAHAVLGGLGDDRHRHRRLVQPAAGKPALNSRSGKKTRGAAAPLVMEQATRDQAPSGLTNPGGSVSSNDGRACTPAAHFASFGARLRQSCG